MASKAAADMAASASTAARKFREIVGVVVGAGKMDKTVTVRVGGMKWNRKLQKYFKTPHQHLVHDPFNSLRLGDVLAITPGWVTSKHKRHVVSRMILPGGTPMEERPPIPTEAERIAMREEKRAAKVARRDTRREEELKRKLEEKIRKKEKRENTEWLKMEMSGIGRMMKSREGGSF